VGGVSGVGEGGGGVGGLRVWGVILLPSPTLTHPHPQYISTLQCEENMSHTEMIDEGLFPFPSLAVIYKPKEQSNMTDTQHPRE
jgi:hypothetical protein